MEDAFFWKKMLERQRRWFVHGADGKPIRDECNRFVPSVENPLPELNPFDKRWERDFMTKLGMPQPGLIAAITEPDELLKLAPTLPQSWVLKPVGAAYSDGVYIVHKGTDCTPSERGEGSLVRPRSRPLDVPSIVAQLNTLRSTGGRRAEVLGSSRKLEWNLSAFLLEELVECESGIFPPIDYRCYVVGSKLLWVGINHLNRQGVLGLGYVDAEYAVTPPIHNAQHIQTFSFVPQEELPPKPSCWDAIVTSARSLGAQLGVVRARFHPHCTDCAHI
jgi:hypothetical protein